MSDPTPAKISELTQATVINDTDDFVIVQGGNSRRVAQSVAFAGGSMVGDYIFRGGNAEAISASHPRFCLTNFENSTSVDVANYPDYIPWLRAVQVIYLEGLGGQTNSFSGTVAGSVITLDNNAANVALIAALNEDNLAFSTFTNWRTVDIDGTTFAITALNTTARTITVTGSPSTGTQNATFYPHRIAGSTTTARLISLIGRSPIGAGTGEVISGLLRRDRIQGHQHITGYAEGGIPSRFGSVSGLPGARIDYDAGTTTLFTAGPKTSEPIADATNGTPRTGPDTHGPDFGAHIYQYVGRVQ